jgi:tRNA (cmo5U34)-methyltransferase
MNKQRTDAIWQSEQVVSRYLSGVRASIPLAEKQLEVMMQVLTADNNQIHHFLDLGCGDGIIAQVILDQFPKATGICLDFSEPMLAQATVNLSQHSKQVRFILSDYSTQNYLKDLQELAPFDTVVSGFSIHHQPDGRKKELYEEIYKFLKPNGFFINIEHVKSSTAWVESLWHNAFIDGYAEEESKKENGKTRDQVKQFYFNDPSWIKERKANILSPVDDQCLWLRDIGFTNVDCFLKIYELAVFGGQKK